MMILAVMMVMTISANAMSYNAAKHEALFLSDKMMFELNLTTAQYEAVYEINLDYLMSLNGHLLRTQISHISIWFVVNRTPYSHSPTDSAYALLNFALGCLHRGQRQSSGKSSKVTPSCSAGS